MRSAFPWVVLLTLVLALAATAQPAPAPPSVSLQLRDAEISNALQMLFKDSGKDYTIEQGVSGRVSVSLTDVPWEKALRSVLDSARLTCTRDDSGVYAIKPRSAEQPVIQSVPAPAQAPTVTTATTARKFAVIKVQNVDPAAIASLFGGITAGPMFASPYGNTGAYPGQYGQQNRYNNQYQQGNHYGNSSPYSAGYPGGGYPGGNYPGNYNRTGSYPGSQSYYPGGRSGSSRYGGTTRPGF